MLCEINPLIVTPDGEVRALDAKVTIDDSALFRHPELAEMRDTSAADPLEALAREKGVTYVKLDGSVGILGNGAGLSMATVDVVVVAGGRPANFCDLGGGGSAEGVVAALEVITRDPQVRSIFFNIFGGITRCDEVARGILAALDRIEIAVPIVVRLDGTNAEEGRRILADAGQAGQSTSSRRCSRRPGAPWSWPHERRRALERPRGALPDEQGAQRGARPRPRRRVGRPAPDGARRRDRRRPRRPAAARGRARGRDLRPGARDAARRDLLRRGAAVRRRELRRSRLTRVAAHHFADVADGGPGARAGVADRVIVVDTLFLGETVEEAERLRDPSHVRNYSEEEWRSFFAERRPRGRGGAHVRLRRSTSRRGSTAPAAPARTADAGTRAPRDRIDDGRDARARPDRLPRGRPP